MRITAIAFLLLTACTVAPPCQPTWVEFEYLPGWTRRGTIIGKISETGLVRGEAWSRTDGRRVSFEFQMPPEAIARVRTAIAYQRAHFGEDTRIRAGLYDAGDLHIIVFESLVPVARLSISGPSGQGADERDLYRLWNDIMRSIASTEYDSRVNVVPC